MAEETVGKLAETTGTPLKHFLLEIEAAGLPQRSAEDAIEEDEKVRLLAHLNKGHAVSRPGEPSDEKEAAPKKITLKRRSLSTLRTTTAGRSRTVNVEVRKKRQIYVRRDAERLDETAAPAAILEKRVAREEPRLGRAGVTDEVERKRQEAAARRSAALEAKKALEEGERRDREESEEKARKKAEEEKARKEETAKTASAGAEESRVSARKDKRDRHDLDTEDFQQKKSKQGNRKRRVEELVGEDLLDLTEIVQPIDDEPEGEAGVRLVLSSPRVPRPPIKPVKQHKFTAPTGKIKREVELGDRVTIQQLSQRMSVKATSVIKTLFSVGINKTINESIDRDTATLVVEEFGHSAKLIDTDEVEKTLEDELVYAKEAEVRAPVVTVMGHVDHGKTSLLDYIRNSRVASGEAGGITQHIGAYRVDTGHGEICFIDTPGHAAFTAMRARGANVTDVVILVVAADDGVMPQTEEAIQHAKGAGAPIIVAVNKMDKDGADPERVKSDLAARDVLAEDWGGDVQLVPVSAMTGQGIEALLEAILLQAELLELKAVQDGPAQGVVIESELDKGKGPVATLLVANGTLKRGDIIVAGQQYGRVRALTDDKGRQVKAAGPATPVAALGLNGTPNAGEAFLVTKDEKRAREVAEFRRKKANEARLDAGANLDTLFENFGLDETRKLNVVVKADVRGSLEAIVSALSDLGNEEVKVNVVMQGVGGITESDATYAVTAGAVIFGFNVRADGAARKVIESEGLDVRYYKVIYDLLDDVKAALSGMLSPEVREEITGIAQVRDVFHSRKMGRIAGCMVVEGRVSRARSIRVLRDNVVIYEGELESLRHYKDEVENVSAGTECGIGVRHYNDVRVGDQIEVFDTRQVVREL